MSALGATSIERFDKEFKRLESEDKEVEKKGGHIIPIDEHIFWYTILTLSATILVLVSIFTLFIFYNKETSIPNLDLRYVGILGFVLVFAYILLSLGTVRLDEWGGLTFFGRPVKFFDKPGIIFRPWGLLKLVTEPKVYQKEQFPGSSEKIVRFNNEDDSVERYKEGEVRPIFVTTGSPTEEELEALKIMHKKGLTRETEILFRQFTVDISFFIRWRVADLFVFEQVIIGDTFEERRIAAVDQLKPVAIAELKKMFGELTPATVILCWEQIGRQLALRLRKITRPWGIYIDRAGLTEQNLSHETHSAQAEAIRSAFTKISTVRNAEAEQIKRAAEGEGDAQAIIAKGKGEARAELARLKARAEGLKKIAIDLDMSDKQVVLLAELAEQIATGSNYAIYGGADGVKDLFAAVSAIKGIPAASATNPDNQETIID